jgi:hypothetical protein
MIFEICGIWTDFFAFFFMVPRIWKYRIKSYNYVSVEYLVSSDEKKQFLLSTFKHLNPAVSLRFMRDSASLRISTFQHLFYTFMFAYFKWKTKKRKTNRLL